MLRHAGPVPIRVSITVADGRLELEVMNPLSGAVGLPGSGSGLRGMRERAALRAGRPGWGRGRASGRCAWAFLWTAYAGRMPFTVLLVDDEPLMRAGLRAVLEAQPDIEGESLLFPAAVRQLAAEYGTDKARAALDRAALTDREAAVLRLMARGLSNAEIAATLVVGTETVKSHVSSVLAKLGARDRTQAVIAAYESGFVAPG